MTILMMSYHAGKPFVPDSSRELVALGHEVWHYQISALRLVHYNSNRVYELSAKTPWAIFSEMLSVFEVRRLLPKIDVLQLQMLHLSFIWFNLWIRRRYTIASYWGSDFYRSSRLQKLVFSFLARRANRITFTNERSRLRYQQAAPVLAKKSQALPFHLPKLDIIDRLMAAESKDSMLECLGLPRAENTFWVCVGYNASPHQNHLDILDILQKMPLPKNKKIHLLLPLTYSGSPAYIESVKSKAQQSGLDFTCFETFLTDEDLCRLRIITDLFIQLQNTDQFSGSMQEAMYAGATVITGSWLPYEQLVEAGIHFHRIDQIADLKPLLPQVVEHPLTSEQQQDNRAIIGGISSWRAVAPVWKALYENV